MENEKRPTALFIALALLVAIVIWVYVDEFGNNGEARITTKTFSEIPIEYLNEEHLTDQGLMVVPEGTDTLFSMKLEGTRWLISEIDPDNIRVMVDLSNVTSAGMQAIRQQISYNGRTLRGQRISGFSDMVKETNPTSVIVNIGELNSKTLDVRCEIKGNVADTYSAGQLKLSNSSIDIWGQAEDIEPFHYAKITLDIGQDAVTSVSRTLPVTFYDKNGNVVENEHIRCTVTEIQATLPISVTKELRLAMSFTGAPGASERNVNCLITPQTITVSGDASKLKDIDTIVLGSFDLLELEESGATAVNYEYSIIVPNGCTNLSGVTRAAVKMSFKDMLHIQVNTNRLECQNLPEGKIAELQTETVGVNIFGTSSDVSSVTGEQVVLVADLADYSAAAGSYTVPVKVRIEAAGDIGVSGEYEVQLTIKEEEEPPPEDEAGTEPETGNELEAGNESEAGNETVTGGSVP